MFPLWNLNKTGTCKIDDTNKQLPGFHGPCYAQTSLRAYMDSDGPDHPARSGPSLSANRIIGYYKKYEWTAKARLIVCARAEWYESAHFAHARWCNVTIMNVLFSDACTVITFNCCLLCFLFLCLYFVCFTYIVANIWTWDQDLVTSCLLCFSMVCDELSIVFRLIILLMPLVSYVLWWLLFLDIFLAIVRRL